MLSDTSMEMLLRYVREGMGPGYHDIIAWTVLHKFDTDLLDLIIEMPVPL